MTRPSHNSAAFSAGSVASTAPKKTRRRAQLRLGPIRVDVFVTGRPWWLPLDRR